jgi:putative nucleotidyltransferase with HDIG domain
MPNRDDAWKLVCEYTQSESLRKHMLAVEACVRAYARKNGADEELWGVTALVHDFDYERWPNDAHAPDKEHPSEGAKILREHGYGEEMVRAILSHADYCHVPRQSALEHTLFACDELAGFLTACSYVRPSKSILDLEVSSVKKRMKDKAFARAVSREDITKGAAELGVSLEEHIGFCIATMREQAEALGLRGTL